VVDEVVRRLKGKFKDLKSGGYKIFTTVDLEKQKLAKESLRYGFLRSVKELKESPKKERFKWCYYCVENKTG